MNAEIEGLRKILGTQEEMMANAGLQVQSYTELLDQEFWDQVPTKTRRKCLPRGGVVRASAERAGVSGRYAAAR